MALHALFRIAEAWHLEAGDRAALLGISKPACVRWQSGQTPSALGNTALPLGYILDIYVSLHVLLPEHADAWVHCPNAAPPSGGEPALKLMTSGTLEDLKVVADYLRAVCGGDFS